MSQIAFDHLSSILGSEAKMRALKAFFGAQLPLSQRQIEKLSGLAIRSVQLAVKSLIDENILLPIRSGRRVSYRLNSRAPLYSTLSKVFAIVQADLLLLRSRSYSSQKAQETLAFSDQLHSLLKKVS